MQADTTFEKWLSSFSLSKTNIPVQPGMDPDQTSILSRFPVFQKSTSVDRISLLGQEVRSTLGIIHLSVEILQTHPPAMDSSIYLDIIARCSLRIGKIINELQLERQGNSQPVEKYSIQQLFSTPTLSKTRQETTDVTT